jgi:hypothetical protein
MVDARFEAVQLHDGLVTTITHNAERRAVLVTGYLDAMGLSFGPHGGRPYGLSPLVLLELGAVLQLAVWERAGIAELLRQHVPSVKQATGNFLALIKAASGDSTVSFELLSDRICTVALEHLGWDAEKYLRTDIVLSDVEEDQIIDALAEFAWSHRKRLS